MNAIGLVCAGISMTVALGWLAYEWRGWRRAVRDARDCPCSCYLCEEEASHGSA